MAYLLEHANPHATRGYHGHPTRTADIDCIIVHTAESAPDLHPPDTGAQAVARYAARTKRAASYHVVVDSRLALRLLPDDYTAFHARGYNARGLGISFACRAADWPTLPDWWIDAALEHAARIAAAWCRDHDLQPEHISPTAHTAGARGFMAHAQVDPTRRTDPGDYFPWARFLAKVRTRLIAGQPEPTHPAPDPVMPLTFVDRARNPNGPGWWWLLADGGIANFDGAPYYGHLLDPNTLEILAAALDIPSTDIAYRGQPAAIEPNNLGGYTVWTDEAARYVFHSGTI